MTSSRITVVFYGGVIKDDSSSTYKVNLDQIHKIEMIKYALCDSIEYEIEFDSSKIPLSVCFKIPAKLYGDGMITAKDKRGYEQIFRLPRETSALFDVGVQFGSLLTLIPLIAK